MNDQQSTWSSNKPEVSPTAQERTQQWDTVELDPLVEERLIEDFVPHRDTIPTQA